MSVTKFALTFSLVLVTTSLSAITPEQLYNRMQYVDRDFTVFGTVCEEAARIMLEDEYPPSQYAIDTGISYSNTQRTIGELDVVVFDKQTQEAELVGEVKCWSNPRKALNKAQSQLNRFGTTMASDEEVIFKDAQRRKLPNGSNQFDEVKREVTIGQKGVANYGFDYELDLTLEQFSKLREKVLACQRAGQCPKRK
jgi:hypothetical protein